MNWPMWTSPWSGESVSSMDSWKLTCVRYGFIQVLGMYSGCEVAGSSSLGQEKMCSLSCAITDGSLWYLTVIVQSVQMPEVRRWCTFVARLFHRCMLYLPAWLSVRSWRTSPGKSNLVNLVLKVWNQNIWSWRYTWRRPNTSGLKLHRDSALRGIL